MDLELVEDAGGQRELRGSCAVNENVPVARCSLCLGHGGSDVVYVGDERPLRRRAVRLAAGEDEDRDAVVVVAAPVAGRLDRPAPGDDRSGRHRLAGNLAVHAAELARAGREEPLVEAVPAVPEAVVRRLVGAGDESVERHGHVEDCGGHRVSFPVAVRELISCPTLRGAPTRRKTLRAPAIAAAVLGIAAPAASALTRISGPSPFEPGCSASTTDFVTGYEAEPSLASDPRNPLGLIAAWQQDRSNSGGDRGNLTAASSDGGKTWRRARLPGSAACDGGNGERASDPWVSIGPDGIAYVATLNINPSRGVPSGPLVVSRSTNGGRTWRRAVAVAPDDGAFNDKEAVTADPRRPGRAYLVWNKISNPSNDHLTSLWFSRTTDGGRTWSHQREIHPPPGGKAFTCSEIVVRRDGSLLNLFSQLPVAAWAGENEKGLIKYFASRSADGGRTWGKPRRIAST